MKCEIRIEYFIFVIILKKKIYIYIIISISAFVKDVILN